MPIYPYVTDIGGGFRDSTVLTRWLNVTRRNILMYALAQNLPKVSALCKLLLEKQDSQPFQHDFVIFPVYGGPDSTNQTNMQPRYIDFTTGTFTKQDYFVDVLYAKFTPSGLYQTFTINFFEGLIMESPNNIIDTVQLKIEEAVRQMFVALQTDLMGSRGTNDQKFYGIKDVIDNGVNQTVFGGLDRSQYPWWNSPVFNYQDLIGNDTGLPIYAVINRGINKYWDEYGNIYGLPRVAFTDTMTFTKIAESFMAFERYMVGDVRNIADIREYNIRGIDIGGVAIFPDPYLQSYTNQAGQKVGDIYFINFDHIFFTGASPIEYYMHEWWSEVVNGRLAFSSLCLITGQFYTDRPRAHFVIKGVPSL